MVCGTGLYGCRRPQAGNFTVAGLLMGGKPPKAAMLRSYIQSLCSMPTLLLTKGRFILFYYESFLQATYLIMSFMEVLFAEKTALEALSSKFGDKTFNNVRVG